MAKQDTPNIGALTFRQLEVFAMAARSPTFSEAAKRLGITQPSLSKTISKMESLYGLSLFDRTTRTLVLTPEGERLAGVADDLVRDFQSFERGIGQSASQRHGRMSLTLAPSVAMSIGPKALELFFQTYPDFDVGFHDVRRETGLAWVRDRIVDFGIIVKFSFPSDVTCETVYSDGYHVICPANSPLARKASLTWRDLKGQPFFLTGTERVRQEVEAAAFRARQPLQPKFEVEEILTGVALAQAGHGLTIFPGLYAQIVQSAGLASVPLHDPALRRHLAIVRRADRALTTPMSHMIDCFRQCFGALTSEA